MYCYVLVKAPSGVQVPSYRPLVIWRGTASVVSDVESKLPKIEVEVDKVANSRPAVSQLIFLDVKPVASTAL